MVNLINAVKEDFKGRLDDLDKYYSESLEEISNNLEQVKIMARDSVQKKEQELMDSMKKLSDELRVFVDENIDEMVCERKQLTTRIDKEYREIKTVCSNYFEKYDAQLQEQQVKQDLMQKKYQNWNKVLIEPQSFNDARLFALEARMHKEEEVRVGEYDYLRDTLKKLVYSLEQDLKVPKVNKSEEITQNLETPYQS